MKRILILLFILCSCLSYAQTYKHIGVESGLSSRKVYYIQKDQQGYMWFLTHEGIDRYNGKEFKQYTLSYKDKTLSSQQDLSWLFLDKENTLWVIGKKGRVFKYEPKQDEFIFVYQVPDVSPNNSTPVTASFIDSNQKIWLSCEKTIYLYDIKAEKATAFNRATHGDVTCITQHDDTHYFIGTDHGLYYIELKDDQLTFKSYESLSNLLLQVNDLFFDKQSNQLFIGTFQKGIYIFNFETEECISPSTNMVDLSITRIKPLNNDEVLIATDGAGIYKMDARTHVSTPYIVANYNETNNVIGNNINDLYVDGDKRIWISNYPIGITIRDDRYTEYKWIKHAIGNRQSLINDRVNALFEDNEGDLWFATSNGVCFYSSKTHRWESFLSSFNASFQGHNDVFLSLCEVSPGIIYAGGYSTFVYKIDKNKKTTEIVNLQEHYEKLSIRPDKYIRAIVKDSQGHIWIGGYHNLIRIDIANNKAQVYPNINSITSVIEKDANNMWVGTTKGLFLINKTSGNTQELKLLTESNYIYSLCQTKNNRLYIGTNGSGLLIYDINHSTFIHRHKDNSPLLSNNIYTILSDGDDNMVFSSESGLTRFYPKDDDFHNWTKEQGLRTNHFNQNAGIVRSKGTFVFGSSDGAVEFKTDMQLPRNYKSKMIFSDFKLFYESVYPGHPKSPLKEDIDKTRTLSLNYNQNIFSLKVSSINYDYPSNVLYSWKLAGFYDSWSRPSQENVIRFTNLESGKYKLHVRAISNEDKKKVIEEREIDILIRQPFWKTGWAICIYLILGAILISIIIRLSYMRKQRRIADEKFQFFINTAHDIRTPLTLIKAPLEDINEKENLSEDGKRNMGTAIRNVNVLLRLTTNLLNFERIDIYSSNLYIAEYELNSFMGELVKSFNSYAEVKKVDFMYDSNFRFMNVWFDKEKMDSILKNIISNALKYTPENGTVQVYASENANSWSIEVKDTGIGIPANEQKKMFKVHFRASNAINSKITGSGIGMVLVGQMVKHHKGKIVLNSAEQKGTTIKVTFPKGYDQYNKAQIASSTSEQAISSASEFMDTPTYNNQLNRRQPANGAKILIAEDNDELRNYMYETLSEDYTVVVCDNGKKALDIVKEYNPDLVMSDVMMPEMRGDELCQILKNDIETSHIPVMLLTALNDEKNMLKGIQTGADEYIIKPFNIGILRATIKNLLANRAVLRSKFANLEIDTVDEDMCNNCTTDLDWIFVSDLKKQVELHMDKPNFNIDFLASIMNMSRTSLYGKVKALTDLAPIDYVRHIRLNRAAELLKEGKHNVTEVAELTGFNDAKYFREVFKKHFNVSPSKYKG
ncbi:two-component regulator propeller domain-containing protein [Bacteroides sp. 224]|uniref:hybrid sensor histidine kinase/response regulator transcription factor n=1 Tax=Bacteroides sp. 224 TaxID=2302936 RepID=UPI0013CF7419|nr:two-component regulator propeller domain-containing protein [Bacteroides sp. 224]NDV66138.1 hybrid sensor histidine kinase/response regulator [Bacteroides sp. 224]